MKKKENSKPTSPHLQIYRWNMSSLTSIAHRLTGVVLYFSIILIVWYIVYYAYQVNIAESEESCDCPLNEVFKNLFYFAAIALTFSLYYHFCNGIRHLFWDIGIGFDTKITNKTSKIVIFLALLLTVATASAVVYLKIF